MIDFHTHIYPPALAGRALYATGMRWPFETDGTIEGQLKMMDKYGIRKCAALCISNRPDEQENVNNYAIEISRRYPERIFVCGSVHPHAADALEELERLYEAGIRGIKFQPIRQHFYLEEAACRPIFRRIGELGMVTVIHCGKSRATKDYWVEPKAVEKVIDCFMGAPVVCAHMGGMYVNEEELERLYPLPVFMDTALSARHLGQSQFECIAEKIGPDRLLFGTDMPWAVMRREQEYILHAGFSEQERNQIFDTNADRLVKRVQQK